MSGYEIDRVITLEFRVIVGPCKVYNTLTLMERNGFVAGISNRRGRTFCVTKKGLATISDLPKIAEEVQSVFNKLRNISLKMEIS